MKAAKTKETRNLLSRAAYAARVRLKTRINAATVSDLPSLLAIFQEEHSSFRSMLGDRYNPHFPSENMMSREVDEAYAAYSLAIAENLAINLDYCYFGILRSEVFLSLVLLDRGYIREAEIEWEIADILLRWLPRRKDFPEEPSFAHGLVTFGLAKIHVKKPLRQNIREKFDQAAKLFEAAEALGGNRSGNCAYFAGLCFEGMGDFLLSLERFDLALERYEKAVGSMRRAFQNHGDRLPKMASHAILFKKTADVLRLLGRPQEAAAYQTEAQLMIDAATLARAQYRRKSERRATNIEKIEHLQEVFAESNNVVALDAFLRRESLAPVGRETDVTTALPKKPSKLFTARHSGKKSPAQQAAADLEVVNFIKEVYGPYLVEHRAKLLAYIREHDPALTNAIAVLKRNNRLPPAVYIPSRTEALEELVQKAAKEGLKSLSKPERRSIRGAISRRRKPSPG